MKILSIWYGDNTELNISIPSQFDIISLFKILRENNITLKLLNRKKNSQQLSSDK